MIDVWLDDACISFAICVSKSAAGGIRLAAGESIWCSGYSRHEIEGSRNIDKISALFITIDLVYAGCHDTQKQYLDAKNFPTGNRLPRSEGERGAFDCSIMKTMKLRNSFSSSSQDDDPRRPGIRNTAAVTGVNYRRIRYLINQPVDDLS
ncbi:hypothetical protein PY730_27845 (plasmid) [Klebsiella pneumoniae]|nr:hypothetical protein PY730_27845 [Klebsiella pneumoniae]